jgi:hypothetical protein
MYPTPHPDEHGEEYASKNGMMFLETSAMEGHNIDKAFSVMISGTASPTQK